MKTLIENVQIGCKIMNMTSDNAGKQCIRGDRVEDLYDRDAAERAEINLLTKIAKQGFERFSLAWLLIDRQWQIVAFAE